MARSPNPYHVDSGPYRGIGEGISNLGQLFFAQSDPLRQAQAEQAAWAARQSRENVTDLTDARTGRQNMGGMLADFDAAGDNRQLFAEGIGSGSMDPANLGALFHMMQANFGGTDDQVGRSHVGMGNTIGTGDGFSLPDREGIAQRDQDFALESQRAQDAGAMARLLQTQRFTAGQNALNRTTDAAGAEDPLADIDWLDETRRSSVEGDMEEAFRDMAQGLGIEEEALSELPADLREAFFAEGMRLLADPNSRMTPRQAASRAWQNLGVGVATREEPRSFWFGSREVPYLDYTVPASPATPAVLPSPSRPAGPPVGAVESGYEFLGGDPADPNNWRPVE